MPFVFLPLLAKMWLLNLIYSVLVQPALVGRNALVSSRQQCLQLLRSTIVNFAMLSHTRLLVVRVGPELDIVFWR